MRAIQRFFAVVSYDRMKEVMSTKVVEFEDRRNQIRAKALEDIEKLNPTQDGIKIQEIMIQMNRDLTSTYERETILRDFIDTCK